MAATAAAYLSRITSFANKETNLTLLELACTTTERMGRRRRKRRREEEGAVRLPIALPLASGNGDGRRELKCGWGQAGRQAGWQARHLCNATTIIRAAPVFQYGW